MQLYALGSSGCQLPEAAAWPVNSSGSYYFSTLRPQVTPGAATPLVPLPVTLLQMLRAGIMYAFFDLSICLCYGPQHSIEIPDVALNKPA